jgi:hypothetical protein
MGELGPPPGPTAANEVSPVPDLLDQLRGQRAALRTTNDGILTRAADEQRDLTGEELAEHTARAVEVREFDDRIEQVLADQVAELRAAQTRRPGATNVARDPVLTREQSVHDWLQARGAFEPAEQELSFDRYLRGLATARWDGAEHERALAEATVGAGARSCRRPCPAGSSTWPATRPGYSRPARKPCR